MDVSVVTGRVTLLPESSGEVLVDVVNTEDVIDALDVGLGGIPGASVRIDSAASTLFPGERRRLALRVQLPSQVPAGRHRAELEVRGIATGLRRAVDLEVDVPPQPGLAAGTHPAVRRALRLVDFPVTVTNRGNTPLRVLVRELDLPDPVTVEFEPAEFDLAAWSSLVCRVRVTGPRRWFGGDQDHAVDLLVTARSTTPGWPLLESDLREEARVTFRQKSALSPGAVLASVLVTVAVLWLVGGIIGLKMFVRLVDPGSEPAEFFFPGSTAPPRSDAAITVFGKMVSAVDGSGVAAVTVLACSRETTDSPPPPCTAKTATARTISDGNGDFWLPSLFPGPYQLRLTGKGLKARTAPVRWFDTSCSVSESVSAPRAALTVVVVYPADVYPAGAYPADAAAVGPVTVTVHQAIAPPADSADVSASPSPAPSATDSPSPIASASIPPCPGPGAGSASASNGAAAPIPDPSDGTTSTSPAATTSTSPAATASAWATRSAAGDGTVNRTATVVVKRLPAPARYDLTIEAGAGLTLTVREVHLNADEKHPVVTVTLQPSPSPTPSAP